MIEVDKRTCLARVEQVFDVHVTCNKCGVRRRRLLHDPRGKQIPEDAEFLPDDLVADDMEASAFVHVSRTGGYGDRAFGDGVTIEFDLCQDCLRELADSFKVPVTVESEDFSLSPADEPQLSGAVDFFAEWATWGEGDDDE